MELGISSLGHLIEYGIVNKDRYNSLFDLIFDASKAILEFSEENGFKVCELVLDPPDIFNKNNKKKFIELCNSYSIKKQVHGPFIDMGLCSHNERISKASIKSYEDTAKVCTEIGVKIITIHPGLANFLINSIKGFNLNQLKKAVNLLLDEIMDLDLIVCMENMPKNTNILLNEIEIDDFFLKIGRRDLFFTYDTSHAWTNNTNVEILWEKLHNKIKNVHIVDNFSKDSDTHPALGSGKIDFKEIFEIMNKYAYDGSLIIELSQASDLSKSIEFIKQYL